MRSAEELRAVTVCVVLRKFRLGEKSHGSVSGTAEELSNHRFFLFPNPSLCFLFPVSVCSAVRSCPGTVGCPSSLLRLYRGSELQPGVPGGGKGVRKCFGRMSKTLETLLNSHFSLFAAFLVERQKEGRDVTHGKWAVRALMEKWEL